LVYDNRVNRQVLRSPRAMSESPAAHGVSAKLAMQENPHVIMYPYPAMIYMDRSWLGGLLPRKYWCASLAHETGHVLGLVSRQSQPGNPHCPTNWCLMN